MVSINKYVKAEELVHDRRELTTSNIRDGKINGRSLVITVRAMKNAPGSVGTIASLALRLGQAFFSSSSILFMSLGVGFYSYTAFCFLVTIMGLVIPWSLTLAILDGYSILAKFHVRQSGILQVIIIGDSVLSILTLAAASSTSSIVDLLLKADVSFCPGKLCRNYQISATSAFLSWSFSLTSSLSNLWLLPSLEAD